MFPAPQPIRKAPKLDISDDVVLLDIDNIVPQWDIYTFTLNIQCPGKKQVVIRMKCDPVEKENTAVQTGGDVVVGKPEEQIVLKLELKEPKIEEEAVFPHTQVDGSETFTRCPIMPCQLLIRRDSIRNGHAKYMVRPFDIADIPEQSAIRRGEHVSFLEEHAAKRTRVV